jgi:hypothetical protein
MPGCQTNEIYFGTIELGTIIKPFSLMIRLYATFWQDVVLMSIIGLISLKVGLEVLCHWVGICLSILVIVAFTSVYFTMLSALYFLEQVMKSIIDEAHH